MQKAEQAHVDQVKEVITRQLALNEHEYQKAQLETSLVEKIMVKMPRSILSKSMIKWRPMPKFSNKSNWSLKT